MYVGALYLIGAINLFILFTYIYIKIVHMHACVCVRERVIGLPRSSFECYDNISFFRFHLRIE